MFAPKGTPDAIVNKIQADVAKILSEPDFLEQHVERVGFTAVGNTPEQFRARIASDTEQRKKLLAVIGLISN
jgi:tripartite-type tricarboxylate transporter receptor subunit TctC